MPSQREQITALKAAEPEITPREIVARLGVPHPAVWKALNPQLALDSDRRSREKRRTRRREIDQQYNARRRAKCETCGKPCGKGTRGRVSRCQACIMLVAAVRQSLVEGMWADGWLIPEINETLGLHRRSPYIVVQRSQCGWDLPHRYAVQNGKRIAA